MVGWALRAGGSAARAGLATATRSGLLLRPAVAPVAAPRLSRASVAAHEGAAAAAGGALRQRLLCSSAPARSTAAAEAAKAAEPPPAAAASPGGHSDEAAAAADVATGEAGAAAAVPAGGDADGAAAPASSSSSSSSTTAAGTGTGTSVSLGAEFISRPNGRPLGRSPGLVSVSSSVADAALLDGGHVSSEAIQLERELGKLLADSRFHNLVGKMCNVIRDGSVTPTRRTFIMAMSAATRISWASAAISIFEAGRGAGVALGLRDYNALLRTLARVGAVDRMRAVIDEMWSVGGGSAPDTRSYDHLVTALAVSRVHTVKDALDVTDEMRSKGVMPSVGTYERFVAACVAANKIRMATATLAAMDAQGVAANARTYAVVLAAASNANMSEDVAKLLPLALASLDPYAKYLRHGPAKNPRYQRTPVPSSDTSAGAGTNDGADAPPSGEARPTLALKPRLEVSILIAAMAASARTNHAGLANKVWALARSPVYADWTPPAPVVQALLSARAGNGDIPAAFDAVDEMMALGYDPNAVRCRALINALSQSPQQLDDAWYLLLARKAAAAGEGASSETTGDATNGDMSAGAAAAANDATEETPAADADDDTDETPAADARDASADDESTSVDDATDSPSVVDATADADMAADAPSPAPSSIGTGILGGPDVPSAPTVAHLNILLRACSLAGDAVRAQQTFDSAEAELGVVPDAFSYVALARAQLADRDMAASLATLDTLATASDTIPRASEAADEAMTQRVLLLKLDDRLDDAIATLRESVDATVAALAAVDADGADGAGAEAAAAAATVRHASSLPFKFLARRARQLNDDAAEAEVLRLAAVAGFEPADVMAYIDRRPRPRGGGGGRGRGGGHRFQGGGGEERHQGGGGYH